MGANGQVHAALALQCRMHSVRRGRSLFTSQKQKVMGHLTEAQYKIIADRMIEEHRKYGDRLRPGHWADVAARKVASHIADFREGERVFTESEMRAIIMDVLVQCFPDGEADGSHNDVVTAFGGHGIVLDPA